MPPHLASSGLVLVNWPEGMMFPGEEPTSHSMPKGISDSTSIFLIVSISRVKLSGGASRLASHSGGSHVIL